MLTSANQWFAKSRRWIYPAIVLIIAAGLRLINLSDNPGWYTDEGTHLDIARHLANGQIRYLAITGSTLLFAKLPLFEGMLAGLVRLFGVKMITLRGLTAGLGILSVMVLFWALQCISGSSPSRPHPRSPYGRSAPSPNWRGGKPEPERRLGVRLKTEQAHMNFPTLSAILLAIYPAAVLYSRFGFSYNLLAPLFILCWLGMVQYRREHHRKWLVLASIAAGLGTITDIMAITLLPPIILIVTLTNWKDLLWSLPLIALPFAIYLGLMLIHNPDALLFDLRFTLDRLGSPPLPDQIRTLIQNYTILMTEDIWFPLGVIGLFALSDRDLRWISLLFFHFPILAMGRTVALHSLTFYYMIPLLPFIAVGIAALVGFIRSFVTNLPVAISQSPLHDRMKYALPVAICGVLLFSSYQTFRQVNQGFHIPIDSFLIKPEDARQAAQYVNAHAQPGDVVIASPGVAWLIEGDVADFQMAMAAAGQVTPHLPADLPPERFAFDPRFEEARFVMVDPLWDTWAIIHIPGLSDELLTIRNRGTAFQSGSIEVYEEPND